MRDPLGGCNSDGRYRGGAAVLVYVALLALTAVAPLAQEPAPGEADSTAAGVVPPDTSRAAATLDPPADRRHPRPDRAASWITSDRFVDRMVEGESVSFLYGNVYLDRDSVVVRADSARVYRDRSFVRLFSDVQARSGDSRLASQEADYFRDTGDADFRGAVRVWEGTVLATSDLGELREGSQLLRLMENAVLIAPEFTVRADTLVRDSREDFGEAFGEVRIVDPGAATLVTGRHARYADDGTWARVDREPALVTREEGGTPVRSVARDMHFFRTEERVVMTDSVQIRQGLTLAIADTAVVFGRERMLLTGRPEVSLGNDSRMRGDRISFFYSDGKLNRVILLGNARMEDTGPDSLAALYAGLPQLEVIEGDSIAIDFADGEIYSTTVIGAGQSVYVPLDIEDEVAFNEVTGDTIVLGFAGGKVRTVDVRGSMQGTYHFARLSEIHGPALPDSAAADSLGAAAIDSLAVVADSLTVLVPDTLATAPPATLATAPPGSLATAAGDTLIIPGGAAAPWDFARHAETVVYSGHAVQFDLQSMTIAVTGDAELTYDTMTLTADEVQLDTRTRELYAQGKPMLKDQQTIVGDRMGYDFGNKTGAVRNGVTTFDGYYYVGDEIHRYPDGSVKIGSGKMTSCDLAEPHYHFWSDRMKLRLGDQVVAAPIVLRVGHVPIFALPFYFKSLEEGRRSGILFPNFNFGWSQRDGRYIRDFGYYWATNDYTDFVFEADYNERREFAWRVYNRYAKRYGFDGAIGYSRRQTFGEQQDLEEWRLNWNHNQPKLFDEYQFRASVDMASQTLSRSDLNANVGRDIVDSELKSTAYISRNFGLINTNVNLERTEQTNATDDDPTTNNQLYQMTLPSLSLSVRQITLAPALKPGLQGSFLGNLARNTYFSQGYSARYGIAKREQTIQRTANARGNWGLSVRPPRIGPFNPSFGSAGSLAWQRDELAGNQWRVIPQLPDTLEYYARVDTVTENTDPALSFNGGATTTLYGVFPVRVGPLRAIRHTFNLGASVSYRPQLGDKQQSGQSYGFNVGNRFDAKYAATQAAGDTAETLKKVDGFLDWTMSTGYSPTGGREWSNVNSNVTIRPGQSRNLSVKMTNTIDPYSWSITQTSLSYGYGFQGRFDTGWSGVKRESRRSEQIDRLGLAGGDSLTALADSLAQAQTDSLPDPFDETVDAGYYGDLGPAFDTQGADDPNRRDPTDGGRFLPWALSGSISYNRNNAQDTSTARAGITLTTNLTRDWQFMYTTSVDLSARAMTRQEYRLQRDLHCWRLEFNRTVSAVDSQFGFRFFLKAIPELKLTQGKEDLMGTAGGLAGNAMMGGF